MTETQTAPARKFSSLGIKVKEVKSFVGESIEINKVLNKPILIHHWKIGPSKFQDKGSGQCLTMQITYNERKRVIFTGASCLIATIQEVPEEAFPIETTIVEDDSERFQFT